MSGIGAVLRRTRGGPSLDGLLGEVASALQDLGPDGTTTAIVGPVGFVHTARRGLTAEDALERQPVEASGGRLTLVFDGRVDNRDELRRLLSIPTEVMPSITDSALFARVWERFGPSAADHVIGPFAAIVWDDVAAELIAVRDPMGQRTLHWHESRDRFVVASAPRAIHACGVRRELDEIKLADSLLLNYHDATRTFFAGISRLARGHAMHLSAGRRRITEYRNVTAVEPLRLATDGDYVEAARAVLEIAVESNLRTVAAPSMMLSSGLDSTLVAATAEPILATRGEVLHTYTSVPLEAWRPHPGSRTVGDESRGVDAFLCLHPDMVHTYVRAPGKGPLHDLDETIAAADAPPVSATNLLWIHEIHRLTRQRGASVVLTGGAGNLTLGWPGDSLARELAAERRWRNLWTELASANSRFGWAGEVYHQFVDPHLPRGVWDRIGRLRGRREPYWWTRAGLKAGTPEAAAALRRAGELGFDVGFRAPAHRDAQVRSILDNAMNEIAEIDQALGAMHGTETRDPLFDRRVAEFAFAVPTEQYRRNGVRRWLQRRLLEGHVPPEVLRPTGRGRQAADARLRMAPDRERIRLEFSDAAGHDVLSRLLDLDWLKSISERNDWWDGPDEIPGDYLEVLAVSRAIAATRFVRSIGSSTAGSAATAPSTTLNRSDER